MNPWILHARQFIVTSNEECLNKAIAACHDRDIARFLSEPDLHANKQIQPSRFQPIVTSLMSQERIAEAFVTNWLGNRYIALAMAELETYGPEHQAFIQQTAASLAEQSDKLGFSECQALFTGLLATGAAKLRRDAESFGLFDRAVALARQGVQSGAHENEQLLAGLLSNYGNALRSAGRHADAIHALTESVAIRRRLPAHNTNGHLEHLASSLSNLAAALGAEKRFREIEALLLEAATIQRTLTERPKGRRALAGTLSNLAFLYIEQRRYREAQEVFKETIATRRALSAELPEAHLPDLAATLNNFGMLLGELRDYSGAIHSLQEAVGIRRKLTQSQPSVFEEDLATSLNNLGNNLSFSESAADLKESLAAYTEALQIRRRLASRDQRLHEPALAQTLANLAALRCTLGQHAAAAATFQEVATIFAKFSQIDPQVYEPQLAGCLGNLGQTLFHIGDLDAARTNLQGSAALWHRLATTEPEAYEGHLAGTLNDLALTLSKLGCSDEALLTAKEAIIFAERLRGQVHLAKGDVSGAYWLVLSDCVHRDSPGEVFAAVSTVRDPGARLTTGQAAQALGTACAAIKQIETTTGTCTKFLIVEKLSGDRALLAVLCSEQRRPFQYHISNRFVPAARLLFTLLHKPFTEEDATCLAIDKAEARKLGESLWEILPSFVQQALDPAAHHDLLICGDPDSLDLPWEALHLPGNDGGWLGLHRHLARLPDLSPSTIKQLRPARLPADARSASILCPWNVPGQSPLPGALAEAEEVGVLLQRAGFSIVPDGCPILGSDANIQSLEAVLTASPSIVHFAGHGDIVRGEVALVLAGPTPNSTHALFDRQALARLRDKAGRDKILSSTPAVFLNACWAGRSRAFGGQREDLSFAFLAEGAGCVVACPTPVYDDAGQMLATLFYVPSIQHPNGLGTTFQRVRALAANKLRDQAHWWSWFWMRYLGNPYIDLSILSSQQRSIGGRTVTPSKALELIRDLL